MAVVALLVVLGATSLLQMSSINASTVDIANRLPGIEAIDHVQLTAAVYRRVQLQHPMASTADSRATYEQRLSGYEADMAKTLATYEGSFVSGSEDRADLQAVKAAWSALCRSVQGASSP